ncbi:kinetochore protein NUF2 homolog [Vitis riparia]|uniref:kinetochore protein NUF2 homolog n=1 Tax=Vitis riparia TaxID=96939 RepID=UPI00155A675C|nr:kinetochore protein NUF2 homolog [Vitis riparia]
MSKFEYPMIPRSEIIAILNESKIATVYDEDLINPNPDFVSDLYTRLLIHLDSLQEDPGQVEFAALERLENPDWHRDSVRIMNLYSKIKELVASLDCPWKFTLKDLIRPDRDRTEKFLGTILNFFLHKDSKMNELRPIVEESNLLDEERKLLEDRISQLDAEITDYNEARERAMPLVQEIEVKVKDLRQAIPSLNNQQMSLRTSFRKMKEKVAEMDEKISSAEFALVQSVQENANLRSKIVQSPDKLQRTLEEKKSVRVEAKNAERSAMQSFQEKSAIVEVYTKAGKKMSKHFAQMQAIQEQVNSAKAIEKDLKVLKTKLSEEGVLDKSFEAKLLERQRKVEQLDELRKQLEKERNFKCEEAAKELNNVKLAVESKRRELEARQRKVEAEAAEVDATTLKINSVKESGAAKQQKLAHKGEEIVKEFHQYANSIGILLPRIQVEPEVDQDMGRSN